MTTVENTAEKTTTRGTSLENIAGITTAGKSLIIVEITGGVLFVNGKMNGLHTVTERQMTSENQRIVQNGASGQTKLNGSRFFSLL